MANASADGVFYVDTSDTTLANAKRICGIKYIGNASGTLVVKSGSSSGAVLFEESGASNVFNEVEFRCKDGLHITLTNSAKVYIYTC